MKKAFFINGGSGRVLSAIPALEYYLQNTDPDVVIVAEAWIELFLSSEILRNNVYPIHHKGLFTNKLKDKEIVSPEPYRFHAYFNQEVNLIQAFDMLINDLDHVPQTKTFQLTMGKSDIVSGLNLCNNLRQKFQKEKIIVFQPFGAGAMLEGLYIIDETGRSFEIRDVFRIIEELGQHYGIILMSHIQIPADKPLPAAMPDNMNLLKWLGIINAADYFLGCDSVGQHFANALGKPATVVVGSTFPENISYPDNPKFQIIDNGIDSREYSPIRLSSDYVLDRNNENLMLLNDATFKMIIDGITGNLGKSSYPMPTASSATNTPSQSCGNTTHSHSAEMPEFYKKLNQENSQPLETPLNRLPCENSNTQQKNIFEQNFKSLK